MKKARKMELTAQEVMSTCTNTSTNIDVALWKARTLGEKILLSSKP